MFQRFSQRCTEAGSTSFVYVSSPNINQNTTKMPTQKDGNQSITDVNDSRKITKHNKQIINQFGVLVSSISGLAHPVDAS